MQKRRVFFLFGLMLVLVLLPGIGAAAEERIDLGDQTGYHRETGMVTFIGTHTGRAINVQGVDSAWMQPLDERMAILDVYAPLFGENNPGANLTETSSFQQDGFTTSRFQQSYRGVPVLAGELVMRTTEDGRLISLSGELSPDLDLSVEPGILPEAAVHTALAAIAKYYGGSEDGYTASAPALWILDPRLLEPSRRPASLVWRVGITGSGDLPVDALVLVDAQYGFITLQFNQIDTAWVGGGGSPAAGGSVLSSPERANQIAGTPSRLTYDANNGTTLPGTLVCNSDDATCATQAGSDLDVYAAHVYAGDTYDFYWTQHGRDSIDDAGMTLISSAHFDVGYCNAFWDGYQMVYGDGCGIAQADDVVAHELTHGVTEYTSNLLYYYQAGAISESFSDLWGEFVDLTNGAGNDDPSVRWLLGEDIGGVGATRSMSNPPAFSDPDMMSSGYYYTGSSDNGGVHTNSGVNNKAVYLMVDGAFHNGYTVSGIGIDKVAAIYYEVQISLLTSGSDYLNLYYAINQACSNLTGGAEGITGADCIEVSEALWAVEMNEEPYIGFNPEAEVCPVGTAQEILFEDDFESGTGNWSSNTIVDWYPPLDPGATGYVWPWVQATGYATSGLYDYWGIDASPENPDGSGGILRTAMVADVNLPATSSPLYLRFNHSFDFEYWSPNAFDGGILEYRLNGGSWTDASSLFVDGQDYNGTLDAWIPSWDGSISTPSNPRGGDLAFTNTSHGYVSSRYDLSAFSGDSINFRWLVAVDHNTGDYGWDVDDVQIYSCVMAPDTPTGVTASDGIFPTKVKLTWDAVPDAAYYKILRDTDSFGGSLSIVDTTTATTYYDTTTTDLVHYFYWISACNAVGCSIPGGPDEGWSDLTAVAFLFEAYFESGDLLEWTRFNDGDSFLYACGQAAINGSWGACVERGTNDKRKQLIDETPVDQTAFNARFNFDINSLSMSEGERFRFVQTKMGAERPYFIVLKYQGGQYSIQLNALLDDTSKVKTGWYLLTDAAHTIEIGWGAASGPGANDGFAELYIDDVHQETLGSLDNDTVFIESFRMGFTSKLSGKTISGIFYVDDVATGNSGYLGLP